MYYYEEDVKQENITEVFDNLEDSVSSEKENNDGEVDLNDLANGGEQ